MKTEKIKEVIETSERYAIDCRITSSKEGYLSFNFEETEYTKDAYDIKESQNFNKFLTNIIINIFGDSDYNIRIEKWLKYYGDNDTMCGRITICHTPILWGDKMKTFYLNGNKESNMSFKEYGQLYNYLLSNYQIEVDTTGEQIVITKEILEDIIENDVNLPESEATLIGNLWYNIAHTGGYIFR